MRNDEPYKPDIKSGIASQDLKYRPACKDDSQAISELMADRNPQIPITKVHETTDRELQTLEIDPDYRLYVAELDGQVVGFCRYYHSRGLPHSKKIYPAPEGWYGMGILVNSKWRRNGIARFLSLNRQKNLKADGVSEIYSIVDESNLTSVRMHHEFGYQEIDRAPGFLHVKLESGKGILFRLLI